MPRENQNVQPSTATEERQWHDAFLVHPPLASFAVHERYLRRLVPEQWKNAEKALRDGFVLGLVANSSEAVDAVAHVARRLKLPLLAEYVDDDLMLYIALDDSHECEAPMSAGADNQQRGSPHAGP